MDLLIHHATVLTQDGAVAVRGDRILAAGDSDALLAKHPERCTWCIAPPTARAVVHTR